MKKILFLLTLITFIFLISDSCKKKCESNNLGNVSFTPTDLQIIPYNGTETLTFSDSLGNSMIFKGTGRSSQYNGNCSSQFPNNPDCQGDYFCSEINEIQFPGEDNHSQLWLSLEMDAGNPYHQNITKYIWIFFYFNDVKTWSFDCTFNFNNLQLYNSNGGGGSIFSFNDSLTIGPKKFYSVYVLTQVPSDGNLQYVFYCINNGIVGFKEIGSKTWYLNN